MISRVRNVFFIACFGVLGGLVKNILLARELPKDELGQFSLLMTIVGFVYPLSLFGQHNAFVRFIADKAFPDYNWFKQIKQTLFLSAVFTCLAIGFVTPVYQFTFLAVVFVLIATFATGGSDLLATVFRAQGRYELSMFSFRLLSLLLPLPVFLLLYVQMFTFSNVLLAFSALYLVTPVVIAIFNKRSFQNGTQELPKSIWKDGLLLWGSDLSLLVIYSIDRLFIPKLMDYEALGEYFAIFAITRVFDLVLRSVELVLFPHVKRSSQVRLPRITAAVLGAGLVLSILYVLFGDVMVAFLYRGKYDDSTFLIPFFCVLGIVRLLHVIPYSIIGSLLERKRLQQMFYVNILIILLSVVLSFFMIKHYGLIGAVLSSIAIWSMKTAAGFGIMFFEGISPNKTITKNGGSSG
ncbi:MAG: lipopolysaccharide biosynthesis protein [bacterium]